MKKGVTVSKKRETDKLRILERNSDSDKCVMILGGLCICHEMQFTFILFDTVSQT